MMKTMNEIREITATNAYDRSFWNAMRSKANAGEELRGGLAGTTGAFYLPSGSEEDLRKAQTGKSVIRSLATVLKKYDGSSVIWAADSEDYAAIVPENAPIPGIDAEDDFTRFSVGSYKIASLVKLSNEFALDASFDLRKYVKERMSGSFARTEDRIFVNGSGTDEPHGLLHETEGAETGVTAEALSYDAVIDLFFSVKPEYRTKAVWLMNDRTALALRKLKDAAGNYLWNTANDTILGKPVRICNEMPDISAGAKPVLFGDLRYYWIIDRSPVNMKPLMERFALSGQTGYVGFEFLDSRLVRSDAVKVLTIE